jgi:hypothetical protein
MLWLSNFVTQFYLLLAVLKQGAGHCWATTSATGMEYEYGIEFIPKIRTSLQENQPEIYKPKGKE